MAVGKKAQANSFIGFVDSRAVTKSELELAENASRLGKADLGILEEIIEDGYTINLKYDSRKGAYIAQLFSKDNKLNKGWILSSFAGSLERALLLTLHKHIEHYDSGKWEYADGDNWG